MKKHETKQYWIEYFKKLKLPYRIRNIDNNWDIIEVDDSKVDQETIEDLFLMSLLTTKASYALHCRKCDRWFFNGWYQTKCKCGNKIPEEYWYP